MKWAIRILGALVALLILAIVLNPKGEAGREKAEDVRRRDPSSYPERAALDRRASSLIYTKHARCRMGCRQISEPEVVDILQKGEINYRKSDINRGEDPKYAVEGLTRDGQNVRIIFAQSKRGVVVVTVIDLEREWSCACS
jgi:hypothetical protein